MADNKTNGQNTGANANNQALTANQKEQIRLAVRTIYRDWRDPHKLDSLPAKGMEFNMATDGLVHSKETRFDKSNLKELAIMMDLRNPTLDKWTDEALQYVSKFIDISKLKADGRTSHLLEIGMKFETWFKRAYEGDKRKTFKGENLKVADILDYFIYNKKEFPSNLFVTLPNPINKRKLSILKTDELELINSKMSA